MYKCLMLIHRLIVIETVNRNSIGWGSKHIVPSLILIVWEDHNENAFLFTSDIRGHVVCERK